jgi:hypothetical protein
LLPAEEKEFEELENSVFDPPITPEDFENFKANYAKNKIKSLQGQKKRTLKEQN